MQGKSLLIEAISSPAGASQLSLSLSLPLKSRAQIAIAIDYVPIRRRRVLDLGTI